VLAYLKDLHRFSGAMAKAAVRSFMDGYSHRKTSSTSPEAVEDLLIISGKGLHSEKNPILQSAVLSVLSNEYGVKAKIEASNPGRIVVDGDELREFVSKNNW
jgi:DNA-nicking Smr family endonuclease